MSRAQDILNQMQERVSSVLYHRTGFYGAKSILDQNRFRCSGVENTQMQNLAPPGYTYYLSTTRSPAGSYNRGEAGVTLVLDGNRFNHRYPGNPVNYFPGGRGWKEQNGNAVELEDRVYSKTEYIPNAVSYIKEIHMLVSVNYETADKISNFCRPSLTGDDHPIEVYWYDNKRAYADLRKDLAVSPQRIKDKIDLENNKWKLILADREKKEEEETQRYWKEYASLNQTAPEMLESMSSVLYHATSTEALSSILSSDQFRLTSVASEGPVIGKKMLDLGGNRKFSMSFSRSREGAFGYGSYVTLNIDGDRLNQRFYGKPVDFFPGRRDQTQDQLKFGFAGKDAELEDRLFSNDPIIKGACRYIREIHLLCAPISQHNWKIYIDRLSEIVKMAKTRSIPIFLYQSRPDYTRQNRSNSVTLEQIKRDQVSEPSSWYDGEERSVHQDNPANAWEDADPTADDFPGWDQVTKGAALK